MEDEKKISEQLEKISEQLNAIYENISEGRKDDDRWALFVVSPLVIIALVHFW